MANVKISDLAAATEVAGDDEFPFVQSSTTKKATGTILQTFFDAAYARRIALGQITMTGSIGD